MLILRQSTAIDIRMGPFVDATDGVTPETGITLAAADQAEVLKENGAATVAMAGTFAAITGCDGWYDYTASATDTDTVGEIVFVVQDSSVCLPVFVRGMVVEEAVYDAMYESAAAGPLQSTVAGRTLDVTATGAAGIDWGNVENPTTAVDLSATDIQLCDTVTTNTDMRGTDNALLAASAPTNFGDLAITVTTGQVTVGTNNDKTGYSLTQTFPTNFADLSITATTGRVDVGSISGTAQTANDVGADVDAILLDTAEIGAAGAGLTEAGGTGDHLTALPLNDLSAAQVNAEVVDALNVDTYAEPGQGAPGATVSLVTKIGYLYKAWRNRSDQTATEYRLYNDDAATVDQKATVSDDATTATKNEVGTGP